MTFKGFIFVFYLFFLASCAQIETERSLYLWKVNQELTLNDTEFFTENKINNLYIRFFDVGIDSKGIPLPKGELKYSGVSLANFHLIPTIFIENDVFRNKENAEIIELGDNIYKKIKTIIDNKFNSKKLASIQFDCDWTESTKDNYFFFLENFQNKYNNVELSVTIRLHQIKYQQDTGIPPVKKGTLMYYNMGEIKEYEEKNSILNNEIGALYINDETDYPLELSLALPVYSWGIWYKNTKLKKLIYSINEHTIKDLSFLTKQENNLFEVNKDTVFDDKYLRNGDIIRLEIPTTQELELAKSICSPLQNNSQPEIILFSYDTENSNFFSKNKLEKLYSNN